jgi:hypothetical protein
LIVIDDWRINKLKLMENKELFNQLFNNFSKKKCYV